MADASCKKIARLISHGERRFASIDRDNNRTVTDQVPCLSRRLSSVTSSARSIVWK